MRLNHTASCSLFSSFEPITKNQFGAATILIPLQYLAIFPFKKWKPVPLADNSIYPEFNYTVMFGVYFTSTYLWHEGSDKKLLFKTIKKKKPGSN